MVFENYNMDRPLPSIFPKSWTSEMVEKFDLMEFRNLSHFKSTVSQLRQIEDDKCGLSYKSALDKLVRGVTDFPESEQASIRNLVRSNLHKRGLITQEVYEEFKYATDGVVVGIDVGKFTSGEPDCAIVPTQQYVDFFYELYISISYPWDIPNDRVRDNTAKLLATIEELERQHIFIKITLVLPIRGCSMGTPSNFFSTIPLFSHKEQKSVSTMSSVINERLLRKFYFAILETHYGGMLTGGYGHPVTLSTAMNIGNQFDEIAFFESITKAVGA